MTTIVDWPSTLKPQHNIIPYLEKHVASSGASLSGVERVLVTDAGRWRYGFSLPLRTRANVMAWKKFTVESEGRANIVRVPICDFGIQTDIGAGALTATVADNPSLTYSDLVYHSDGTGFTQAFSPPLSGGQGSSTIKITLSSAVFVPQPGHFFSHLDRLYLIKTVTNVTGLNYQLTFLPRFRFPAAFGDTIKFSPLTCLMRLSDESFLRADRMLLRFGDVELDFTEAITP